MADNITIKDGNTTDQVMATTEISSVHYPINIRKNNSEVDNYISSFAQDLADSNNENGNKDYSVTPGVFTFKPASSEVWHISRLMIYIRDTGSFDADKYGNNITLTNGIKIEIKQNGVVQRTLTNAQPIMSNSHWGKFCYDTNLSTYGTGDESLAVRWTITKAGTYIKLSDALVDTIEITLNDDLSGLVEHTFLFQGYKE